MQRPLAYGEDADGPLLGPDDVGESEFGEPGQRQRGVVAAVQAEGAEVAEPAAVG